MARTKHGLPGIYNASVITLPDGAGSALAVDSAGRIITVFPTGTSGIGKAEDSAHASGDIGVMSLAVRTDTPANRSGTDGDYEPLQISGGYLWNREGYAPVYEDNANGKAVVEHRYSTSGVLTADTQVKSSPGFVHTVTISQNDAAPTAGTIDIYDNTSAAGTKIFTWTLTTAVFVPFSVTLDVSCGTGIYVDFTTTADVAAFLSYR